MAIAKRAGDPRVHRAKDQVADCQVQLQFKFKFRLQVRRQARIGAAVISFCGKRLRKKRAVEGGRIFEPASHSFAPNVIIVARLLLPVPLALPLFVASSGLL